MVQTVTPLEAALSYAAMGWPVVPLHTPLLGTCDCRDLYRKGQLVREGGARCKAPGKHPRTDRGLDDSTTDPEKIARWWKSWPIANVGIDLNRAGLVDIAPDSLEWHAIFVANGLPPTPSFRSGGGDGHEHYLYSRPADCPSYRICKTDEYDVMANGYAVMPPSMHASGQRYAWLQHPTDVDTCRSPEWAVSMLKEVASRQHVGNGVVHFDDDAEPASPPPALSGEALARWCGEVVSLKADGSVDRSHSLWEIGLALARAGASRATIANELQERDEALGWSKYVGRRDSRTRYFVIAERALSGKAPARLTGRAEKSPAIVPMAEDDERYRFVVRSAPEFLALNLPPIKWLVPGLIREQGIIGNFGGPGTLKTYFATQLGVCLAVGPPRMFLEFEVQRTRVLIVQEDTPESDYQQVYLRPMIASLKINPADLDGWLYVATSNDLLLDNQERLSALDTWLTENQPGLLILDAFFLLHEGEGMTAKDLGPVLRALKRLRKKHRCAIWIVDHNRKQPGKGGDDAEPIDRWYGGRPKSAATDGAIESKPVHGHDDAVELRVVKMRGGQKLLPPFQVRIQNGVLHPFTSSEELSEASQNVYDWLLDQPISRTIRDIQLGTSLKERSIRDAIRSLSERGWIEPGEPVGERRDHLQKTWQSVRVSGASPEDLDV